MQNMNLKMFNKLVDSAEGLEVSFKIGKECELNVKGNFMAMAKVVGVILQAEEIESKERIDIVPEWQTELEDILQQIK